jgi:GPH family glycoside/pentoside/hexuronide:cation symporter
MPDPSPPPHSVSEPIPASEVKTRMRLAYGSSAFAENLAINSINQLAHPIFNITLGVSPVLVGTALAIPRLWDVIIDPLVGSTSDHCQSRWGRRKPFILVGAILTGLIVAGFWMFPEERSPTFYFWWLAIGSFLLSTAYSIFVVPYGALGLELTSNYHERTRVMGTKSILHKCAGVVNQWLLKLVQLSGSGSLLVGGRYCGVVLGFMVAGFGALTAWKVPERARGPAPIIARPRLSTWASWKETWKRPAFVRLILAQVMIYASVLSIDNIGFYLNIFYVNGGDMGAGAYLKGWSGTAFQVGGIVFIPWIVRLSKRVGKRNAFMLCTGTIVMAGVAKWFCDVPNAGWWPVLPSILIAPGLAAVMVLVPSMTADICDLDEVETGERREGMFNAVLGWVLKLAISGSIFFSGLALELTGWETSLGANQTEATYQTMRIVFSAGTVVFALLAAYFIAGYRVTEADVANSRRQVSAK